MKQEENFIENVISQGHVQQTVRQLVDASPTKLTNHLRLKAAEIKGTILHYFQYGGCTYCNAEVANRHLLVNNEKEFQDEVRYLEMTMI